MSFTGLKNFLTLEQDSISLKKFLLLIITAYLFAVGTRFIWVYQVQDDSRIIWNDQIIINNIDGYYYAEGARDILAGTHQEGDGSPVYTFPSIFTAFLNKILPFSFETIILYMPAFFGSLLVIPILLIGRGIGQNYIGFISALLGSIAVSYYNRTMVGYYDTDMLTIVLPLFLLASLIYALKYKREIDLLSTALAVMAYMLWYPGGYSIIFAAAVILFFYTLIIEPKKTFNYKLISFISIGIAGIPFFWKTVIFIILFSVLSYSKNRYDKYDKYVTFIISAASLMLVLFTSGLLPIIYNIKVYILREKISPSLTENFSLNFFSVKQTIQEAKQISLDDFAVRISGHKITFLLSTIGYLLMVVRYPVMSLALPIIALGFLGIRGGLRFTIYAVPINALGFGYISSLIVKIITKSSSLKNPIKYIILSSFTVLALYPNIIHIINYKKGPVIIREEASSLEKLKQIAGRDDYVISWWDYGYPIRYYSDTKTLGDGGRQSGDTNFPLSFILTKDQIPAANMARIAVEFNSDTAAAMKAYDFVDANDFLKSLNSDEFILPKKKQEIYLYLPYRIIQQEILPTIRAFSNLDIMTGRHYRSPLFYQFNNFIDKKDTIIADNSFTFFKNTGIIKEKGKTDILNSLVIVGYDKDGRFGKDIIPYNPTSDIYLIYMISYGKLILMDATVYNSLYIRLFVLEDYDRNIFEPVVLDPWTKIYRLKK